MEPILAAIIQDGPLVVSMVTQLASAIEQWIALLEKAKAGTLTQSDLDGLDASRQATLTQWQDAFKNTLAISV